LLADEFLNRVGRLFGAAPSTHNKSIVNELGSSAKGILRASQEQQVARTCSIGPRLFLGRSIRGAVRSCLRIVWGRKATAWPG
jgi:hypothetical protein